jgi:ATP-binding cassette, subfamily A (ABC1), member 3
MEGMKAIFTLVFLMSFAFPCSTIVKFLTIEKEKQLKETMKIMGLSNWIHWAAWFTKCFVSLTITVTLMVFLLKVEWSPTTDLAIFRFANSLILWIFLMLFGISTIMFSFMISAFFAKCKQGKRFFIKFSSLKV